MSASPNNAGLELVEAATPAPGSAVQPATPACESRHEALQALLAFSSLHEQIRQRRAQERRHGAQLNTEDTWQLEQFVLDEVLQLVAERALAITGADGVAIALAEGDAIICRGSAGSIAPDTGVRLDPNSGFSGACLVSGHIVRCDDSENDPRVDGQACRRLGARSMVAVPLSARQTVVGLLEAFSGEAYGFNDSDVRSLNLLAELVLSAMKPEEEDRLAEISQRVVGQATAPEPAVEIAVVPVETEIPVLHEASESSESRSAPVKPPEYEKGENSRPGLAVVIGVVLFAVGMGAGLWWTIRHRANTAMANRVPSAPASQQHVPQLPATPLVPAPNDLSPDAKPVALAEDAEIPTFATSEEAGVLPEVTGIRHWSSSDSSTVVIDLQDQVQYEAHRLPNPERIYFDLHDTKLVPALSGKTIIVGDALVQRVRVAQPMAGVSRVVLETKGESDYSVSLQPNPYRLVIEVRKLGTRTQPRAKIDLFTPFSQSPVSQSPVSQSPANQDATNQVAMNQSPPSQNLPLAQPAQNQENPQTASARPIATGEANGRAKGAKFRIVLDAGHGGWDLGTVGRKGLLEKDLVLDIVERLGNMIERRLGAEVIYTRRDDNYLALEKRAEIANLSQASLFMSIHANYSDYPSARGVETYYSNTYSSVKARTSADEAALQNVNWTNVDIREKVRESRRFAASVQHALYGTLAAKNPGLPNRGVKEAQYVVLTGTSMPAILAEVSFVSSPDDENNLQSAAYRQRIADALYQGVSRYAEDSSRVKMASISRKPGER
jgi:N-acetylmuramoyl-L-alanine amidase